MAILMKHKRHYSHINMFPKTIDNVPVLDQIRDNDTVAISGFNMATTPEYLINLLYNKYQRSGHPNNLFIISDALPAVPGRALDSVAQKLYQDEGQNFLKGSLMPFLGFSPWFQKLVVDNRIDPEEIIVIRCTGSAVSRDKSSTFNTQQFNHHGHISLR